MKKLKTTVLIEFCGLHDSLQMNVYIFLFSFLYYIRAKYQEFAEVGSQIGMFCSKL